MVELFPKVLASLERASVLTNVVQLLLALNGSNSLTHPKTIF